MSTRTETNHKEVKSHQGPALWIPLSSHHYQHCLLHTHVLTHKAFIKHQQQIDFVSGKKTFKYKPINR